MLTHNTFLRHAHCMLMNHADKSCKSIWLISSITQLLSIQRASAIRCWCLQNEHPLWKHATRGLYIYIYICLLVYVLALLSYYYYHQYHYYHYYYHSYIIMYHYYVVLLSLLSLSFIIISSNLVAKTSRQTRYAGDN